MAEPANNAPPTEQLNLKVKSQDGEEVFFKIKSTTQLKKLMDAYCQRQSVIYSVFSWTQVTCDFCSTERDFMRRRRLKIWIWRMEMRSMLWLSKWVDDEWSQQIIILYVLPTLYRLLDW